MEFRFIPGEARCEQLHSCEVNGGAVSAVSCAHVCELQTLDSGIMVFDIGQKKSENHGGVSTPLKGGSGAGTIPSYFI